MNGEDIIIVAALILGVAAIYYQVGKIVGRGEKREAHDLYQKAATLGDPEQRLQMIKKANHIVFPKKPFIKAFEKTTQK